MGADKLGASSRRPSPAALPSHGQALAPVHGGTQRWQSRVLTVPLALPLLLAGAARADIVALPGSNTQVSPGGGIKVISQGVTRAQNQFFRLAQFDTSTGGISAVRFDNGVANVIVGVTTKSVIDKPVGLATRGNLYFLSPNGISVGPGAAFNNVDTLLLTTSSKLALGVNTFDVNATGNALSLDDAPAGYTVSPSSTLTGLLTDNLKEGNAAGAQFFGSPGATWQAESFDRDQSFGIEITPGSSLTVDRSLLLVTHKAPLTIRSAALTARGVTAGNPNAFADGPNPAIPNTGQFGEGDGLAIVSQNLEISGSASLRSALTSNTEILIREPLPIFNPAAGVLASALYSFDNFGVVGGAQYSGTISTLKISGLDLFAGEQVPTGSTWKVLLRSYGLACQFGDCGLNKPSVTVTENGANRFLPRVGRLAVAEDYAFQGEFKANQALYAGIDLADTRVISGYAYTGSDQAGFKAVVPAQLEFGFDPGVQQGGGRLEGLQFYAPDVTQIVRVDFGNSQFGTATYDAKADFPAQGAVAQQFLNNKPYAAALGPNGTPDFGMYWFYNGDGSGNNSISFAKVPSLPMAANGTPIAPPAAGTSVSGRGRPSGGAAGPGGLQGNAAQGGTGNGGVGNNAFPGQGLGNQDSYIFDNTLFVIDQNVSEDYEPAAAASAPASELLTVNLAPAESEAQRRCSSGSGEVGCESGPQP